MNTTKIFEASLLENWKEIDPDGWKMIVREIIEVFHSTAPARYEKMLAAFQAGDLRSVSDHCHALKSSCGNVGLVEAARLFGELETRAASGEGAVVGSTLREFAGLFEASISELRKYAA